MPIPELVRPDTDPCRLSEKWKIEPLLAIKIVKVSARVPFAFQIISGYRSDQAQRELLAQPDSAAAAVTKSNHTICPARAVDVRILGDEILATRELRAGAHAAFGQAAMAEGLRWGGFFTPHGPLGYNEKEWNHVDLGSR